MKKVEAQLIAPEKSRLIVEYIEQILNDNKKVNARMDFSSYKINNQMTMTLDIYVPESNFEKHLDLGITSDHSLVLIEQLLNDLLPLLYHPTIGITKHYSIYSNTESFSGINALNSSGSKIKINFHEMGQQYDDIISKYSKKYDEIANKIKNQESGPTLK